MRMMYSLALERGAAKGDPNHTLLVLLVPAQSVMFSGSGQHITQQSRLSHSNILCFPDPPLGDAESRVSVQTFNLEKWAQPLGDLNFQMAF